MSKSDKIGNYQIQKIIGEGTFGKVKLARDIITKENVAIKILEKSKIKTNEELERINQEINSLKELNHLNIIELYEILEDEKNYYLILEYMTGGELFSYIIKNEKLNEEITSYFLYQIIKGIQSIHDKKICHRDLKPENILLDNENQIIKIIDFGLSKKYNNNLLSTQCGSICYTAPEIIKGLKYNGLKSDIWSCGILLFAMIYGYLPFDDKNDEILYSKIINCNIEFNDIFFISSQCKDLIVKMLEPNPDKRININDILNHPFLVFGKQKYDKVKIIYETFDKNLIINYMENYLRIDNSNNNIINNINENKHNNITTIYKLLKKKIIKDGIELRNNYILSDKKIIPNQNDKNNSAKNLTNSISSSANSMMNELNEVIKDVQKNNGLIINNLNVNMINNTIKNLNIINKNNNFNIINKNNNINIINNDNNNTINNFFKAKKQIIDNTINKSNRPKTNTPIKKRNEIKNIFNIKTNPNTKETNTKLNSSCKNMTNKKKIRKRKNNNNMLVFPYKAQTNYKNDKIQINNIQSNKKKNLNENNNKNKTFITPLNQQSNNQKNNINDMIIEHCETEINNNNDQMNKRLIQSLNFQTLNRIKNNNKMNKISLINTKKMNTIFMKKLLKKKLIKEKSPKTFSKRFNITDEHSSKEKNNNSYKTKSLSLRNNINNKVSCISSRNKSKIQINIGNIFDNENNFISKLKSPKKLTPEKNYQRNNNKDFTICSTQHSFIELSIRIKKFCKKRNLILIDKNKVKYTIFLVENKKINIEIFNKEGVNMVKLNGAKNSYFDNIIKQFIVEVLL